MTKHLTKLVLDGPREELRLAILEVTKAEENAKKSQAEVDRASDHLRAMKLVHARATSALEEATSPPRTLDQKLKEASSVDEKLEIVDAHNASLRMEPLTAEDLKRMRQGVDAAADALTIARNGLEVAEAKAHPAASVLSRARDRRTRAIHALVGPHIAMLMLDVQRKTEELIAPVRR
jgi:hypothetical protein